MTMTRRARASASATVANLGPGYDVLGLCVEGPRDVVTAELTRDGAVTIGGKVKDSLAGCLRSNEF